MIIISSRRLLFEDHSILHSDPLNCNVAIVKDSIVVVPSPTPQLVPDWVADNDLFRFGIEEGFIIEVTAKTSSTSKTKTLSNEPKFAQSPVKQAAAAEWPSQNAAKDTGFTGK